MSAPQYAKRLIEVDLPIRAISAHARREKSIRRGHISTLHIWWARRPLAACRAVLCASLWPDPADEHCPQSFRDVAAEVLCAFAETVRTDKAVMELAAPHWTRWRSTDASRLRASDPTTWLDLRCALLDFIADFSNWDAVVSPTFAQTAVQLTRAAHTALGGDPTTRPLVFDPFAGGGAIPFEAVRVGADVVASDLNPIAVLLNKVALEYVPRHGQVLADHVRRCAVWIGQRAHGELARFYPRDPDGALPIAYIWARTIACEGPGCGAEVPLVRSLWLSKKPHRSAALRVVGRDHRVDVSVIQRAKTTDIGTETVRRGSAVCPACGFTTRVDRVRVQLKERRGGARDARLLCVVTIRPGEPGRLYRDPTAADLTAVREAAAELGRRSREWGGPLSFIPDEVISLNEIRRISVPIYGMTSWGDLFTARQGMALGTFTKLIPESMKELSVPNDLFPAVGAILGLALSRLADRSNSLCRWRPQADQEKVENIFGRQAVPMMWDFAEGVPITDGTAGWKDAVDAPLAVIEDLAAARCSVSQDNPQVARAAIASATEHPLPDDSADCFFTDPPYYDAVPYAHLSDFSYVWLRRSLGGLHPDLFGAPTTPKEAEIVVDRPHELSTSKKDITFYERELKRAFADARRVLRPTGVGTIVFASKTTASWEAILQAVVDAGWIITGSWPIDTEMENRIGAHGQARLASSVHLVCRPRENPDGSIREDETGAWREVLAQLPGRIHEWMPRLAEEGIVGADSIFACIGPALEIFSRYSQVEKASGERVALKEYLEQVWAAVSREALSMMFAGADASGLEEDARLTAMWLWTLGASAKDDVSPTAGGEESEGEDEEDGAEAKGKLAPGFVLEFDAARKIAQGLGAHLEKLVNVVEVKGDKARLLGVAERAKALFTKQTASPEDSHAKGKGKAQPSRKQLGLFAEMEAAARDGLLGDAGVPSVGETTLDRVHQAMILFAAGRSEALKRFVVEEGVGKDGRFWRLAQSLSALYPAGSDEKRWVDGVLARKKSLGF